MNGFRVTKIAASGPDVNTSVIDFGPGVNIIHGPSNTGKSQILECIDFMLGSSSSAPSDLYENGYTKVSMIIANDNGETFTAEREIRFRPQDDRASGATTIEVFSGIDGIDSGTYFVNNNASNPYYKIFFKLMGINESEGPIEVISNQQKKTKRITIRSIRHLFLLLDDDITKSNPILLKVKETVNGALTYELNSLDFLITGEADRGVDDDPEKKKIRTKAIRSFVDDTIAKVMDRRDEIQNLLIESNYVDIDQRIDGLAEELSVVESQIEEASRENQQILKEAMSVNEELREASFLRDQYIQLHENYDSDIERLRFILDGDQNISFEKPSNCPFCNHEIERSEIKHSYVEASKAEFEKILHKLNGLQDVERQTDERISSLEKRLNTLDKQRKSIIELVQNSYEPKKTKLKDALDIYKEYSRLQSEIQSYAVVMEVLESEKPEEDKKPEPYDARSHFSKRALVEIRNKLRDALKECNYPNLKKVEISSWDFDLIVNDKVKENNGKGYRAFLNSLYAFVLAEYLSESGAHPTNLLILDSPIQSLIEKGEIPLDDSMKVGLLNYIISKTNSVQIIIAENSIPEGVDLEGVHEIEFTQDESYGRYGFLIDCDDSNRKLTLPEMEEE